MECGEQPVALGLCTFAGKARALLSDRARRHNTSARIMRRQCQAGQHPAPCIPPPTTTPHLRRMMSSQEKKVR